MNIGNLIIIAALIHLVVRLLKVGALAEKVPARWRPWIALGLGGVAVAVQALANGVPLRQAILEGALGAASAIATHDVAIGSVMGGQELFGKTKEPPVVPPVQVAPSSDELAPIDEPTPVDVSVVQEEIAKDSKLADEDGPEAA